MSPLRARGEYTGYLGLFSALSTVKEVEFGNFNLLDMYPLPSFIRLEKITIGNGGNVVDASNISAVADSLSQDLRCLRIKCGSTCWSWTRKDPARCVIY